MQFPSFFVRISAAVNRTSHVCRVATSSKMCVVYAGYKHKKFTRKYGVFCLINTSGQEKFTINSVISESSQTGTVASAARRGEIE